MVLSLEISTAWLAMGLPLASVTWPKMANTLCAFAAGMPARNRNKPAKVARSKLFFMIAEQILVSVSMVFDSFGRNHNTNMKIPLAPPKPLTGISYPVMGEMASDARVFREKQGFNITCLIDVCARG